MWDFFRKRFFFLNPHLFDSSHIQAKYAVRIHEFCFILKSLSFHLWCLAFSQKLLYRYLKIMVLEILTVTFYRFGRLRKRQFPFKRNDKNPSFTVDVKWNSSFSQFTEKSICLYIPKLTQNVPLLSIPFIIYQ